MITYEQYLKAVTDRVLRLDLKTVDRNVVFRYLKDEDAYIREMYDYYCESHKRSGVKSFDGAISAAAYGLGMMFEG